MGTGHELVLVIYVGYHVFFPPFNSLYYVSNCIAEQNMCLRAPTSILIDNRLKRIPEFLRLRRSCPDFTDFAIQRVL